MSEDTEMTNENTVTAPTQTELQMLKQRADIMGITYSNNIGVDALRAKIQAKMDGDNTATTVTETAQEDAATTKVNALTGSSESSAPQKKKQKSARQILMDDAMRLIRVRITNLDPKKADLPGEIFTVANDYIGTVRKYVPFGEATDEGYHIPHCIYEMMKSREFLQIKTKTHPVTKEITVSQRWVREFGLEVLPPLTQEELATLAAAQTASGRLNGE